MVKPTIAIIGAGLAGLALGYLLSTKCNVTVFDIKGVGGGTSGIAAGLLHPFVGQTGKLNTFGWEGMEASLRLVKNHILHKGLLRIPINKQMEIGFANNTAFEKKENGYWQEEGYAVDIPAYLLWLMGEIEKNGGQMIQQKIEDAQSLPQDKIILCQGWQTPFVKITGVKGQLLELATLPHPIAADGYIIPKDGNCTVGSTYERNFSSAEPDPSCIPELLDKAEKMVPGISKNPILSLKAGVRASSPNRLPITERISPRLFAYTGLGSRGLLYHALFAQKMIDLL